LHDLREQGDLKQEKLDSLTKNIETTLTAAVKRRQRPRQPTTAAEPFSSIPPDGAPNSAVATKTNKHPQ
jgi:hypothetical protein